MELNDKIAIAASFIAVLSLIVALLSYRLASKSYKISKEQHDERNSCVKAYLIQALKWNKDDLTYISFALNFTNESTIQTSLQDIELHIEYHDDNGILQRIRLDPEYNLAPIDLLENYQLFEMPINIPERSTKSGWISFKTPEIVKKFTVDLYKVSARIPAGGTTSVDTHIINSI